MTPPNPSNGSPVSTGDVVVVKLGGAVAEGDPLALARALAHLADARRCRLVIVHGGGARVTRALAASGVASTFVDGLRVTTSDVLAVAEPVFAHVGKTVASALTGAGLPAISLSGRDAALLRATVKDPALGRVGGNVQVDAGLLRFLYFNGLTPVIAPVALDAAGAPLNVNADEVAAAVAAAIGAKHLVLLTDVPGVKDATGTVAATLTPAAARALVADGTAAGGMIPKVTNALTALEAGVKQVCIASGADAHALNALADGRLAGTVLTESALEAPPA